MVIIALDGRIVDRPKYTVGTGTGPLMRSSAALWNSGLAATNSSRFPLASEQVASSMVCYEVSLFFALRGTTFAGKKLFIAPLALACRLKAPCVHG